jgi:hypothetical protein
MNRTLMEKARSMLSGAGLGKEFWAEAVSTACYLVNRSPSSALDDTTPHEVWSGKKPSLQHLRVFGCDTYVHVPKKIGVSWIIKMKSVSLLVIKMV